MDWGVYRSDLTMPCLNKGWYGRGSGVSRHSQCAQCGAPQAWFSALRFMWWMRCLLAYSCCCVQRAGNYGGKYWRCITPHWYCCHMITEVPGLGTGVSSEAAAHNSNLLQFFFFFVKLFLFILGHQNGCNKLFKEKIHISRLLKLYIY